VTSDASHSAAQAARSRAGRAKLRLYALHRECCAFPPLRSADFAVLQPISCALSLRMNPPLSLFAKGDRADSQVDEGHTFAPATSPQDTRGTVKLVNFPSLGIQHQARYSKAPQTKERLCSDCVAS
jgi:hypothetical protein